MASRELCGFEVEQILNSAPHGSDFVQAEDVPEVRVQKASKKEILSHYIYGVYYRYSNEAAERAEQQMKLF